MKATNYLPTEFTRSSCKGNGHLKKTGLRPRHFGLMHSVAQRVALITAATFALDRLTTPPIPVFAQATLPAIRHPAEPAMPVAVSSSSAMPRAIHGATATGIGLAAQAQATATTVADEIVRSFKSTTPQPDPTSPEFYQVIDSGSSAPNRTVVINGIDLVFDSSIGGLWLSYNNSSNIATFTINARTVTFKSPTALKGANVIITAKELHFQGAGLLTTTPITPQPMLTTGANGTQGTNGGNITLQIGAFFSDPATPVPLNLTGGAGGAPGPGAAGAAGTSFPDATLQTGFGEPSGGQNNDNIPNGSIVCLDYQSTNVKKADPVHVAYYPSGCPSAIPGYPTNGQNAVAGGIPGLGGAGGNLSSTVNVLASATQIGGVSAASAGTYAGGQAGTPTVSAWAEVQFNADGGPYWHLWPGTGFQHTQNGQSAVSPAAIAPQGATGKYTTLPAGGWAAAGYGAQRLAYATALYTSNYFTQATTELQSLGTDLTNSAVASDSTGDISSLVQQINALLYQLSLNLTYFNQQTNFVPLTTLGLDVAAYTDDIASAISILYLQAVVNSDTQTITNKISALQAEIQNAQNDITAKSALITGYVNAIDTLNCTSANLQQALAELQQEAQADEAEVIQQAQANLNNQALQQKSSLFSDLTRAAVGLAELTPFGAPFAPILNAVSTVVTDATSNTPWSVLGGVSTLAATVSNFTVSCQPGQTVNASSSGVTTCSGKPTTTTPPSSVTCNTVLTYQCFNQSFANGGTLQNSIAAGTALSNIAGGITAAASSTAVSPLAFNTELATVEQGDPILANLATHANSISTQIASLNTQINTQTQNIVTAQTAITNDLLAINTLQPALSGIVLSLAPDVVNRVNQLAIAAENRLMFYQQLMLESQQYVQLQPSNVNLDLSRVLSRVSALVAAGGPAIPTEDVIAAQVGLFEQDLAAVTQSIIQYYSQNYSPIRVPFGISLTADQIKTLNTPGGQVIFNPVAAGVVPKGATDVRVAGIQVSTFNVVPPAVIPSVANVQLTATFPGIGRISQGGNIYEFFFYPYPSNAQNPIVYGATRDLVAGILTQTIPSPATNSLLTSIVGANESLEPFITVPADANFILQLQSNTSNGIALTVQNATLTVFLDYVPLQAGVADVAIASPQGVATVSFQATADSLQRSAGVTPAVRQYSAGQTVSITAPPRAGQMILVGYDDGQGKFLTKGLQFTGTASTSLTVRPVYAFSSVTVSSSANPTTSGQSVTLTATVVPASATGTITFMDGTTVLGTATLSGGTATMATSTLAVGSHSLTAAYGGDANDPAITSPVLTQTVTAATTALTTTTLTSSTNPSASGQTVTLIAAVSPATATGTITFKDGTTVLGTATLTGGTATMATSTLAVGSHSLTAAYGGDSKDVASTSPVLTQTVNAAGLSIATPPVLPVGVAGIPYSAALEATGGTGSYQWFLTSGSPPQGVNLVSIGDVLSGLLEGVPATPGTYTFAVTVTDSSKETAMKQFSLTIATTILVNGICNAASYGCSAVSPGEIITIFGFGMGPTLLAGLQLDSNGNVANDSGGTQVLFDGVAAPMIYSVAGQLSCVVPYEVAGKAVTQVRVSYLGKTSAPLIVPVVAAMPGIFTVSTSGVGQGAILNQDGTVNGPNNPANVGDYVFVFATGEGQTVPAGLDGTLDGFPAPTPVLPVSATIGGVTATVQYAGGAPGLVAGVLQVNLQVPHGVVSGASVPILLTVGSQSTQANVTLAIK